MAYSIHSDIQLSASENQQHFTRSNLQQTLAKALPRRLRKHDRVKKFLTTLDTFSEASITWNVLRRMKDRDDHWATLYAWELPVKQDQKVYSVDLFGPCASVVLERLNVECRLQKRHTKHKRKLKLAEKRTRRQIKSRQKLEERRRQKNLSSPAKLQKREKVHAVMSHKLGDVTPQFKKSRVFLEEAVNMILFACPVQQNPGRTSRQTVMNQLFRSFEHTEYRFARIKFGDFSIALTIEGGRWRGVGLTPVRIWCEKNNRHPAYRRLRKWLHENNQGFSQTESSTRRHLLYMQDTKVA